MTLGGDAVIAPEDLTERERQVLALMAEGWSNEEIAQRLFVGVKTVETHVRRIFNKLRLVPNDAENRRVCAVLMYLRT